MSLSGRHNPSNLDEAWMAFIPQNFKPASGFFCSPLFSCLLPDTHVWHLPKATPASRVDVSTLRSQTLIPTHRSGLPFRPPGHVCVPTAKMEVAGTVLRNLRCLLFIGDSVRRTRLEHYRQTPRLVVHSIHHQYYRYCVVYPA